MMFISTEKHIHFDKTLYIQIFSSIKKVFDSDDIKLQRIKGLAQKIKEGIEKLSPFIQQSTERICPNCSNICCTNKHGYYNYEDIVYITALGLKPPDYDFERSDSVPCQFLSPTGCIMEQSIRPSGCNWYFCEDLLDHMEKRSDYGMFDSKLTEIVELWLDMIDEFKKLYLL